MQTYTDPTSKTWLLFTDTERLHIQTLRDDVLTLLPQYPPRKWNKLDNEAITEILTWATIPMIDNISGKYQDLTIAQCRKVEKALTKFFKSKIDFVSYLGFKLDETVVTPGVIRSRIRLQEKVRKDASLGIFLYDPNNSKYDDKNNTLIGSAETLKSSLTAEENNSKYDEQKVARLLELRAIIKPLLLEYEALFEELGSYASIPTKGV